MFNISIRAGDSNIFTTDQRQPGFSVLPLYTNCTVLTRCHSLSLMLPDVHSFCNSYRLSDLRFLSLPGPTLLESFAPHGSRVLVVRLSPTTGNGRLVGLNSLSAPHQTYWLRGPSNSSTRSCIFFSLCPPRKCFPEPRLGTSSISSRPVCQESWG